MEDTYCEILETLAARKSGRGWDGCCPIAHRHHNGDRNPSLRLWVGERGELVCRCMGCGALWSEIVHATGTASRDWWPRESHHPNTPARRKPVGKVTAIYDYRDEHGTLYAQKLRKEPGLNGATKSFSWRRPLPDEFRKNTFLKPDQVAWVWGLEDGLYVPHADDPTDWRYYRGSTEAAPPSRIMLPLLPASLYHLPELVASNPLHPIAVVEGEKKADLLTSLGLLAVSGPNGSRCWDHSWCRYFAGRKIVVLPDNNLPGLAHAACVAGSCMLGGASGVKVVVPGEKWHVEANRDVYDWLMEFTRGDRRDALVRLLGQFPAYNAPAQPTESPEPVPLEVEL